MNAFVDLAVQRYGVRRFVLLAGSSTEVGGWHVGNVWAHLAELKVEYCVLRPTWFMGAWCFPSFFLPCSLGPHNPQVTADHTRPNPRVYPRTARGGARLTRLQHTDNFSEPQHCASIRDEGKIYTACGDGKVPFVAAADIAAVAFRALTAPQPLLANEYRVLGPELLTHDEVFLLPLFPPLSTTFPSPLLFENAFTAHSHHGNNFNY
jgi:hypothetical protein